MCKRTCRQIHTHAAHIFMIMILSLDSKLHVNFLHCCCVFGGNELCFFFWCRSCCGCFDCALMTLCCCYCCMWHYQPPSLTSLGVSWRPIVFTYSNIWSVKWLLLFPPRHLDWTWFGIERFWKIGESQKYYFKGPDVSEAFGCISSCCCGLEGISRRLYGSLSGIFFCKCKPIYLRHAFN